MNDYLRSTEKWVEPEHAKTPQWVKDLENKIKETMKKYYKDPKANTVFKKLLENDLLKGKIKPEYPLNKKNIAKLVSQMWDKFDAKEFTWRYYILARIGFFLSTLKPSSFTIDSLELPQEFIDKKRKLLEEYQEKVKKDGVMKAVSWIDKEFDKLTTEIIKYWEKQGIEISNLINSGARGGKADIRKMLVAVGLSINSAGEINDIILDPQIEGLKQTQFFHYTSQAIQALYSKSTETAVPGYLARKISTITEPIVLSKDKDCKSNKYLEVYVFDEEVLEALDGRIMNNGKTIDAEKDKNLIHKKIKIRSPLFCKSIDGICATCWNPKAVKRLNLQPGARIGLLATTSLGADALVNLTLKKSHVGVSLNLKEVDLNKDIMLYAE